MITIEMKLYLQLLKRFFFDVQKNLFDLLLFIKKQLFKKRDLFLQLWNVAKLKCVFMWGVVILGLNNNKQPFQTN